MAVAARTVADDRWPSEADLIAALKAGDTHALRVLVETLHSSLVRVASVYVSRATAEDAVQDAWVSVVCSIATFEGRASVRTWVFRIVLNRVHTLARKQRVTVPFATAGPEVESVSVDAQRLIDPDVGANYKPEVPDRWDMLPEQQLMSAEVRSMVVDGLSKLPPAQREVVSMRDLEGWSSEETCEALGISAVNQRVLLHRGRSALRTVLETYFHDH